MEGVEVELGDSFAQDAGPKAHQAAVDALLAQQDGDLALKVPRDATPHLSKLFAALDQAKSQNKCGINDYGVHSTTLEEVFVRLSKEGELKKDGDVQNVSKDDATKWAEQRELAGESSPVESSKRSSKLCLLLRRQAVDELRNPKALGSALISPLFTFAAACVILSINFFPTVVTSTMFLDAKTALASPPSVAPFALELLLNKEAESSEVIWGPAVAAWVAMDSPASSIKTGVWAQEGFDCLEAWLIGVNDCSAKGNKIDVLPPNVNLPTRIGAWALSGNIVAAPPGIKIWYNSSMLRALPGLVTHLFDGLLATQTKGTLPLLTPRLAPLLPPPPSSETELFMVQLKAQIQASIAPLFLALGIANIGSYVLVALVEEKELGLRHLQTLMGITTFEYWSCRFLWDIISFQLTLALGISMLAIAGSSLACVESWVLMVCFLWAILPLAYFLSSFLTKKQAASSFGYFTLFFMVTYLANTVVATLPPNVQVSPHVLPALKWISILLVPHAGLGLGLRAVLLCKGFDLPVFALSAQAPAPLFVIPGMPPVDTAFAPLVVLLLQGFIFWGLLILYEDRALKQELAPLKALRDCFQKCRKARAAHQPLLPEEVEDDDVRSERAIIDANVEEATQGNSVCFTHLSKRFRPAGDEGYIHSTSS
jgi:hypothetical protein